MNREVLRNHLQICREVAPTPREKGNPQGALQLTNWTSHLKYFGRSRAGHGDCVGTMNFNFDLGKTAK